MEEHAVQQCTAFEGSRCIASGALADVVGKVKEAMDRDEKASILIFDDYTSELVEVDFRGSVADVLAKLETSAAESGPAVQTPEMDPAAPRGPGRPRLGVIAREVTLLPRHWDWLNSQPGGASVTLRKLVEEARRANIERDKVRHAQETTYRFMAAMAGNLPGFEEAARSLYARDAARFNDFTDSWPADIRGHVRKLSLAVWG
ncbi:MAG TPA: DUF2239 family protein [Candidatus Hydrogenedentes bacterium]|nr:DUF2239 family protein [Candidatus Hydrogenedentota bacterium]HQH53607.1 DUF2239 family protein [Candidatus Hydrogenedentota bacterium]